MREEGREGGEEREGEDQIEGQTRCLSFRKMLLGQ